jgi:hypothetical protein
VRIIPTSAPPRYCYTLRGALLRYNQPTLTATPRPFHDLILLTFRAELPRYNHTHVNNHTSAPPRYCYTLRGALLRYNQPTLTATHPLFHATVLLTLRAELPRYNHTHVNSYTSALPRYGNMLRGALLRYNHTHVNSHTSDLPCYSNILTGAVLRYNHTHVNSNTSALPRYSCTHVKSQASTLR